MDVVVFDLGGVLARICHSWEEAVQVAGVAHAMDLSGSTGLAECPGFDAYQAAAISLDAYLDSLSTFVGCPRSDALIVHNSILIREYEHVPEMVETFKAAGFQTGCLSNTNAPHWELLAVDGTFPTVRDLQLKMASHLSGHNKPAAEAFLAFETTYGVAGHHILFFDDSAANVAAAAGMGWSAYQIDPNRDPVSQMLGVLNRIDSRPEPN